MEPSTDDLTLAVASLGREALLTRSPNLFDSAQVVYHVGMSDVGEFTGGYLRFVRLRVLLHTAAGVGGLYVSVSGGCSALLDGTVVAPRRQRGHMAVAHGGQGAGRHLGARRAHQHAGPLLGVHHAAGACCPPPCLPAAAHAACAPVVTRCYDNAPCSMSGLLSMRQSTWA